jgi:signal transduction histidine kinase
VVVDDFVRGHPEWQPYVRYTPPAAPIDAQGDRMLIRRVLANLVENAIQAAEGAGRAPEVAVSVTAGRGVAVLVVDDNGPGIAPRERESVFDPYVTTKEHGTGLGLAIVRKIVLDHGGDVHASAAPAPLGGARLTVTLPAAAQGGSPPGAPPGAATGGPPLR